MTNVSYAPINSGPFASAIGWINFPTTTLWPGSPTVITNTLRDGSSISFSLEISSGSTSFHGTSAPISYQCPFGTAGYSGISGSVILYNNIQPFFDTSIINIKDIVVKDSSGIQIYNYTVVLADGEVTSSGESMIYETDMSSWTELGKLGDGSSPSYSGWNTSTLTLTGNSTTSFNSHVVATNSPHNIKITINNVGKFEGIAFGIILTGITVNKIVNNRACPDDQFVLSIKGATISSTTITSGNSNGLQQESPSVYITPDSISSTSFAINEVMVSGSYSILGVDYSVDVKNSNLTPGGSYVPSNGTLNESLTITLGDYILTTITNTTPQDYTTNASYAPINSGPFAGAISWVNFPPIPLCQPLTIINTLRDGSTISFTLTNNPIEGATARFAGETAPIDIYSPFGNAKPYGAYKDILRNTILYSSECCNNALDFSNITLKSPDGVIVTDYTIILADGEHTDYSEKSCGLFESGAFITYSTNGTPWTELGRLGIGTSPSYSGLGTSNVYSEGQYVSLDIKNFQSLLLATNSPTEVSALINTAKGGGIAFGVAFTKVKVNKVVNNRAYPTDQFTLSIKGNTKSAIATTTGNLNGLQQESPSIYVTLDSVSNTSFTINEVMAPGSQGILGVNYSVTIQNSNLTPGGSYVSSNGVLNENIKVAFGDYILTTIANTNLPPNITLKKETCDCKACVNQQIPYTLKVKNASLINATTLVITDSYPLGVAIASTTISTGTISNNNSVLTWTIPTLAGGESALAMIFAVPVDDFCYNKNKFLTSTAQIVSYYPQNPSNLPSDTSIITIDCFCCNCDDYKN